MALPSRARRVPQRPQAPATGPVLTLVPVRTNSTMRTTAAQTTTLHKVSRLALLQARRSAHPLILRPSY